MKGVHGFTLDPAIGEFILTHPNVIIPPRGDVYSINEAYAPDWPAGLQRYLSDIKAGLGESRRRYSARYIGSFIADVHRVLLKGGVFAYPGNARHPRGKLVYLHEVCPLAFLVEQAGGAASTVVGDAGEARGTMLPVMQHKAKELLEHVPVFLGSRDDVAELERYLKT